MVGGEGHSSSGQSNQRHVPVLAESARHSEKSCLSSSGEVRGRHLLPCQREKKRFIMTLMLSLARYLFLQLNFRCGKVSW